MDKKVFQSLKQRPSTPEEVGRRAAVENNKRKRRFKTKRKEPLFINVQK